MTHQLSIDEAGLHRVLSEWSGAGGLYKALAQMMPVERYWAAEDIRNRALRIVLLECLPLVRRLPRSGRIWQDLLPTLSWRQRYWSDVPQTRVDWARTRRRGWPPQEFAIRRRHRSSDEVTLSVLAWTVVGLRAAFQATQELKGPDAPQDEQLEDVVRTLSHMEPVLGWLDDSGDVSVPSRDDVRAVHALGWPWSVVAELAELLITVDRGGSEGLAKRLLSPDGAPETVFQLSVLGSVLLAGEACGATITSLSPIAYLTRGPVYRMTSPGQEPWDVWCEAGAAWGHYSIADKYRSLSATLRNVGGGAHRAKPIRPDILVARSGDRALAIECKFPYEQQAPGYVAHGIYQAHLYADQLTPAFGEAIGLAVGPTEIVPGLETRVLGGTIVGVANPQAVQDVVTWLIASDLPRPSGLATSNT